MRGRLALPSACAIVLLVASQLVALAHQAEVRHVTCAEHGEELESARLHEPLHTCDQDHLIGVDGAGGDHEDCTIARALRQANVRVALIVPPAVVVVVTALLTSTPADAPACIGSVLRLAPKTSPPAAT